MIAIGERINGMFTDIKRAIEEGDKEPVKKWAVRQIEAGADYLDVNAGAASKKPSETIKWLVECIKEALPDAPIAIDSPRAEVMKAGLEACRENGIKKMLINSTTGQREKLEYNFGLAREFGAAVICLTMDQRGIPKDVDYRVEVAATHVATAMEYDIPVENIFLDPIAMPVKHAQDQIKHIMEAIRQFTLICSPQPHIVVGLSNVGQGTTQKELVNRTFLVLGIMNGLDAAIVDVCDAELMNAAITAELLLNKQVYSDDFIKAYMSRARCI
ncbi:MAG: dihydropteroate synthase [bacterium]